MAATDRISVAILGPGGVGGLLGALLARAGQSVLVLAGENTSRAIAERGLSLESTLFGDFTVPVDTATRLERPVDACFITVKTNQLEEAVERVPAAALGQGLVIPFLNGLDHVDRLRTIYPPSSVVAATIRVEAARIAPGVIRQTSPFARIEIAPSPDNRSRVESIAAHLKATGLDVRLRDDEFAMLWNKFAVLAPIAILTTHERANVGAVRTRRRQDAMAVIAEVAAVGRAESVPIDEADGIRLLDSAPETFESSMQRDQAAGRPLEIDAIGQAVISRAAKAGIAVPITTRLVSEIRARSHQPESAG